MLSSQIRNTLKSMGPTQCALYRPLKAIFSIDRPNINQDQQDQPKSTSNIDIKDRPRWTPRIFNNRFFINSDLILANRIYLIYLYVMCATQEWPRATLAAVCFHWCRPTMSGTVLTGTNQKEDSPVKMACRVIEVMLTGCIGVSKGIIMPWTLTATTTQSNTL